MVKEGHLNLIKLSFSLLLGNNTLVGKNVNVLEMCISGSNMKITEKFSILFSQH